MHGLTLSQGEQYSCAHGENVVYYLGQIATDRIGLVSGRGGGGVKAVVDIRPTNRKQAPATMACST